MRLFPEPLGQFWLFSSLNTILRFSSERLYFGVEDKGRRWFPPKLYLVKMLSYHNRLVSKFKCESQYRAEQDDQRHILDFSPL